MPNFIYLVIKCIIFMFALIIGIRLMRNDIFTNKYLFLFI